MKTLLVACRWVVGLLFIFSGLVKANDPLGLSYKMQEFFEVWGWHALNDYTLAFSILMIAFEIIAGVAVIIGWQMRLFSWLLLGLIVFFTFLTGYALLSGKIKACGCFGDCIPLTPTHSFIKDLVLLGLILLLFANRNRMQTATASRTSILLLAASILFSFGFQWYVLRHLPVVDCLPYKKGKLISEQMKIPAGAIPDSSIITFVYNRQGQDVEFTADKFPDDFDDATYKFVKRYDKLIRKGNAEPPIKDFVLLSPGGSDTTQAILAQKGEQVWVFIRDLPGNETDDVKKVLSQLKAVSGNRNIPLYVITPVAEKVMTSLSADLSGTTVFRSDAVAVKTAARHDVTIYHISNGAVEDKWSLPDASGALRELSR
ncbi:BT_3928 family protein [Flavihumibacter solisilvae]|uniref:DoxX family protein n=1 Tax=Flavihumibacter solisilvae TaxID=1349421 RepID=A0A0C1L160_9BACT|nr:BT_3928 family protein [Flavihumibacter solisilvae]KIC93757.1 DoxX family protein [Flavihumibacter solisilvae]